MEIALRVAKVRSTFLPTAGWGYNLWSFTVTDAVKAL
jgi:hypothetical protein